MPATAAEPGQIAPEFRLKGPGGPFVTLSEYRGQKNVVLVFYPLAFSPVCSHQLPEVERVADQMRALDAEILGISVDSHYSNAAFARSLGLSFPLLSDWKRDASTAYGVLVPAAGHSTRATFVVDKQGRIAHRDVSKNMGDVEQIPATAEVLSVLRGLQGR